MASVPPPQVPPAPAPPAQPAGPPGVTEPLPRWSPWTAPAALATAFALAILGSAIIDAAAAVSTRHFDLVHPPPGVQIVAVVVEDVALMASALWFASLAGRPRLGHFGLRPTRIGPATGWMGLVLLGSLAFSALWVAVLHIKARDNLPDQLGANRSDAALLGVAVLVTVVAPIAEEVFFRGYFFGALRNWRGPWLAAVLTGGAFGAVHVGSAPVAYLVPLAVLGTGLCLLYWRTRSLYPCIALHSLNNSLALGASEHWDWQIPLLMVGALGTIGLLLMAVGARAWAPAPA